MFDYAQRKSAQGPDVHMLEVVESNARKLQSTNARRKKTKSTLNAAD